MYGSKSLILIAVGITLVMIAALLTFGRHVVPIVVVEISGPRTITECVLTTKAGKVRRISMVAGRGRTVLPESFAKPGFRIDMKRQGRIVSSGRSVPVMSTDDFGLTDIVITADGSPKVHCRHDLTQRPFRAGIEHE